MTRTYSIIDIYRIDEFSEDVDIAEYGSWNPIQGLQIYESDIWKRRSNFKGNHLRYLLYQFGLNESI